MSSALPMSSPDHCSILRCLEAFETPMTVIALSILTREASRLMWMHIWCKVKRLRPVQRCIYKDYIVYTEIFILFFEICCNFADLRYDQDLGLHLSSFSRSPCPDGNSPIICVLSDTCVCPTMTPLWKRSIHMTECWASGKWSVVTVTRLVEAAQAKMITYPWTDKRMWKNDAVNER